MISRIGGIVMIILCTWQVQAQQGMIEGTVTNAATGEPLFSVNVFNQDYKGATTDFDGKYTLKVPAGQNRIVFSNVGYNNDTVTIDVPDGETVTLDRAMEKQTVVLDITTITGGKFATKFGEETVTIDVLKNEIIENSSSFQMSEALEKVPGVTIVEGQANIRGGSGWSYGAGSRVQVLVDDLPVLSADAADAKFSFIPTENVEQVEVVKGATSALYGSSALNGIINVRTAWAKNKPETKFTFYGTMVENPDGQDLDSTAGDKPWYDKSQQPTIFGCNFVHRRKNKQFDLVVGGNFFSEKSYLLGDGSTEIRTTIKTRYRPKNIRGLSTGLNITAYHSFGSTFFLWNGLDSLAYTPLPNSVSEFRTLRLALDPYLTYFDKKDNRYSFRGRYFNTRNKNNTGQGSIPQLFYGEFQFQRKFAPINLNFVSGVSGYYSDVSSPGGDASQSLTGDHTGNNFSLFAQADKKFWNTLTVSFGVRYEYFRIDTFTSENQPPVFRLGLNYQAAQATYLRASWGQGYRFPTIAEKFVNTTVGGQLGIFPNPGLQPESGWSAELGIKQGVKISKWLGYIDLSTFINRYNDMMEFTFAQYGEISDPLFGFGFASQNIGNTQILGMEVTLIGQGEIFGLPTTVLGGYTFIDPRSLNWDDTLTIYNSDGEVVSNASRPYSETSSSEENILKYRSRHTFKADIETQIKKFSVGLSLQVTSFQENIDQVFVGSLFISQEPSLGTQAFSALKKFREENHRANTLFDARIGYQATEGIKISFIAKNLLNQQIMERPALLSRPRNYTLQLSVEF